MSSLERKRNPVAVILRSCAVQIRSTKKSTEKNSRNLKHIVRPISTRIESGNLFAILGGSGELVN